MDILKIAVTLFGIVVTAGIAIYRTQRTVFARRARLKHDLEIVELAKKAGLDSRRLEKRLGDDFAEFVVRLEEPGLTLEVIGAAAFGLAMSIGFGVWTYFIVRDGFSWWGVLTGYGALTFLVLPFMINMEERQRPEESPPSHHHGDQAERSE